MKILFLLLALSAPLAWAAEAPLTFETARARLQQAITTKLPSGFRAEVESIFLNEPAPADARIESITPDPPLGSISFQVAWSDSTGFRHTFGTASVKGYAKVALSKLPLQNSESFTEANTLFEEREITTLLNRGYYTSFEDLRRLKARGYVRAGQVLGVAQTQVPWLVVRGQNVDLTYRRGALSVTAKVTALENGHQGDWIRVQNPSSRKTLQARVVRGGEVETR
jgi:flagella basal body P-ring formation protein FlgA